MPAQPPFEYALWPILTDFAARGCVWQCDRHYADR